MKKLLYIDLFCGAGGTSTGVERAKYNGNKCAEVIACVNHDPNAIKSHAANHPNAVHYTEDIRTLDLTELSDLVRTRRKEKDSLIVLWASLECTNFSNAKGGQPRDADSRTLAEHLFRYVEAIDPDYIQIENVREFMSWGDLDESGKPVSKDKGRLYLKWVKNICSYGYSFSNRILNSANYGAYTSRERFFGIFAKKGLPISFPEPTHSKNGTHDMFDSLEKWKPVREVLDLEDYGTSIFGRKKPLSESTLKRIYAGLQKFCTKGEDTFLVKYNSMSKTGKCVPPSIDEPSPVIACQNRLAVAHAYFLSKQYGGSVDGKNISIDQPSGTITCIDHHALVSMQFMDNQYGNGRPTTIDAPCGTIVGNPKQKLVTVSSDHFLLNPQYSCSGSSIDKPCFTLIARMDKRPPSLVSVDKHGTVCMSEHDSPMTYKIKQFMQEHGISDISMRMLTVNELKRIMGFGDSYVLVGTQAEKKKYIGNAVEVNMSMALCRNLYESINVN